MMVADEDVVNEENSKALTGLEDLSDHPGEGRRSISKTKGEYTPLKEAPFGDEGRLVAVVCVDGDVPEAPEQVYLGEA